MISDDLKLGHGITPTNTDYINNAVFLYVKIFFKSVLGMENGKIVYIGNFFKDTEKW